MKFRNSVSSSVLAGRSAKDRSSRADALHDRLLVGRVLFVGAALFMGLAPSVVPGVLPPPAFAADEEPAQAEKTLAERLSKEERRLLGGDKQAPQKTLAGLTTQVEVLQMQQDKLVEELLRYRRMAKEAQTAELNVPAFGEDDGDRRLTRREKELKAELETERISRGKIEKELGDLQARLERLRENQTNVPQLEEELKRERQRTIKLEEELSELQARHERARENITRATGIEEQIAEKEGEIQTLQEQLAKTKREVSSLEAKLQDQGQLVAGIPGLRRQLQEAKNQLLMKETEMQMLQKSGSTKSVASAEPKPVAESAVKQKMLDQVMERSGRIAGEETVRGKSRESDVLIVEVRAPKANLRSGPGNEHAPIMQLQRGARLTVEQREGDWYRVIAPTGARAYVTADVVIPIRPEGGAKGSALGANTGAGVSRRPAKQVARAIADDSFEPFGDVKKEEPARPKDDIDRAFQRAQQGVQDAAEKGPERE